MSIFQDIGHFLSHLFAGIGQEFRDLMAKAKPWLQKEIPAAIDVVNLLKKFMEGPAVATLEAIIPGDVDTLIADKIRDILPKLLLRLKLHGECANLTSNDEIIQCVVNNLKGILPEDRAGKYLEITSYLSHAMIDSNLSINELMYVVKIAYDKNVNIDVKKIAA